MLKDEGCFWKFPWGCVKIGRLQDIAPTSRAFLRHIEDTQDFACSFSRHGKRHMECLDRHRTLTVNLDVHAVHERHRIVLFNTPFQPSIDLSAHTFNRAACAWPFVKGIRDIP